MIVTPETQHDISIEELEEVDPKVLFSNLQQSTKTDDLHDQIVKTRTNIDALCDTIQDIVKNEQEIINQLSQIEQPFLLHRLSQVTDQGTRNDEANAHKERNTRSFN